VCTTNFGNLTVHTSLLLFLQFKKAKNAPHQNHFLVVHVYAFQLTAPQLSKEN